MNKYAHLAENTEDKRTRYRRGTLNRYRGCGSKRSYTTKEARRPPRGFRAYECQLCGAWHYTSQKGK